MAWQKETDEVKQRRRLLEQGGDPQRIARQHAQGKHTIRERIALLADPGSFQEIGGLAGSEIFEGDKLVGVMPMGAIMGRCALNGRNVILTGHDSTVRHDTGTEEGGPTFRKRTLGLAETVALHSRLPLIRFLDAPGASVRTYEKAGRPEVVSNSWADATARLLPVSPIISVAMGPAAGLPAIEVCMCHFNIIIRGTGQVFPGGPPVVKAALGYEISKEDLGGTQLLAYNGVIDSVANSEDESFAIIKRFLSYLPDSSYQTPPRAKLEDDPGRRDEELLSVVPHDRNGPYNPQDILNHVFDRDSIFEIMPFSGQSCVTAFARVNGYPVGVVAKNPGSSTAGAMDVIAGDKLIRFIQLCSTFHLPVASFVDEPGFQGFVPGSDSDVTGILRTRARVLQALYETKVPWISFIVGRVHAAAGSLAFRPAGLNRRYAWPSAVWGSTQEGSGTVPLYHGVEAFGIEDVIDPRDTRPLLCDFIESAQEVLKTQLGPGTGPAYRL